MEVDEERSVFHFAQFLINFEHVFDGDSHSLGSIGIDF
jgi:hypothetical protein